MITDPTLGVLTPEQTARCLKVFKGEKVDKLSENAVLVGNFGPLGLWIGSINAEDDALSEELECEYVVRRKNADDTFTYHLYLTPTPEVIEDVNTWLKSDPLDDYDDKGDMEDEELYHLRQYERTLNVLVGAHVFKRECGLRIEEGEGMYWLVPSWDDRRRVGNEDIHLLSLGINGGGFPAFSGDGAAALYIMRHYRTQANSVCLVGTNAGWTVKIDSSTKSSSATAKTLGYAVCWAALRYEGVLP